MNDTDEYKIEWYDPDSFLLLQSYPNNDSIWIQPLLFIPFVENAVKHSFDSEHSSYVHVFFKVEAHRLEFRCENSKPAVAVQQGKVGGIGLANIQRRLGLLYPEHYKLEQKEDENLYSVILSITL